MFVIENASSHQEANKFQESIQKSPMITEILTLEKNVKSKFKNFFQIGCSKKESFKCSLILYAG
jgi:hypothetical protein